MGVLPKRTFTMLVIMAVLSTFAAPDLLRALRVKSRMPTRRRSRFAPFSPLLAAALVALAGGCQRPKGDTPTAPDSAVTSASAPRPEVPPPAPRAIVAFTSDAEIRTYLDEYRLTLQKKQEAAAKKRAGIATTQQGLNNAPKAAGATAPAAAAPAAQDSLSSASASEAKQDGKAEGVTNNQHAGVDEGGIVKTHGDHLVILRRGRLFTVRVDGKNLRPVAAVDAFGPGVDPRGTWYDEMLISGNTLVVVGYSYARGGTEVGVFDLDTAGGIAFRATYHLRGNDYFSARNYASRVIGQKLVFYTPTHLAQGAKDPFATFPAVRKWHAGATAADFQRVVAPTQVFRPAFGLAPQALHTVTSCDLAARELSCKATSVLGPAGRVFYVSPSAVYVWMTESSWDGETTTTSSAVVRLPLDGGAPGAVKVTGGPIDQFSFLEAEGHLNVFVRATTRGEAMWDATATTGDTAMLRLPLGFFSEGSTESSPRHYTKLPTPRGYAIQNRFVGRHLLYGTQSFEGFYGRNRPDPERRVVAFPYASSDERDATSIELPHSVDRLEALGTNAIVVGQRDQDLHFTSLALRGTPRVASAYVRKGASQGEQRSHGFFYKPESEDAGMLGLPVLSPTGAHRTVNDPLPDEGSAKVLFLRNQSLDLSPIGELVSRAAGPADDACRASCVDWYGNARPLFLRGRIFGLMGYELVEGALEAGRIREVRRVSFAPSAHGRPAEE